MTRRAMAFARVGLLSCVITCIFACGSATEPDAAPVESSSPAPSEPETLPSKDASPKKRADRRAGLRPFWHDKDLVVEMGLEPTMIENMETILHSRQTASRAARQAATGLRGDFAQALAAGDWQLARSHSNALAAAAAAAVEADAEVKVDILSQLTDGQRRLLFERQPQALRRSWLAPSFRRTRPAANPLLDNP